VYKSSDYIAKFLFIVWFVALDELLAMYECWLWWSFLDESCYRHPLLPPYSIFSSPSNCIINRESKSPFDIPIRQYWSSNIKNDNFLSFLSGRNVMANKSKARISSLGVFLNKYGWIAAFVAALTPISGSLVALH
jgi:hypothetical protein